MIALALLAMATALSRSMESTPSTSNGVPRKKPRTYFISSAGSDANYGMGPKAPWKTFAFAVSRLNPGDTLLLVDGNYSNAVGTGYPNINCSAKAKNGTPTAPITIAAQHERQAFIQGDGQQEGLQVINCSYWSIIGLHVESADFNIGNSFTGDVMAFYNCSHLTIRRNLAARPNRYGNVHAIMLQNTTNSALVENEVYYFHRWGILLFGGSNTNEVVRNYANSRGYPDIAGGYASTPPTSGDFGIGPYTSNSNTFENNIVENTAIGFNVENNASSNNFFGNIAIGIPQANTITPGGGIAGMQHGFRIGPHTGQSQPVDNSSSNDVSIFSAYVGFWNRGGKATYDHDSSFGTSTALAGFQSDTDPCCTFDSYSQVITNSMTQNFSGPSVGVGYRVVNTRDNTFRYDHDNNFNNATNYSPNKNVTNANSSNPGFGGCYLWVPVTSPLKRAGNKGEDIGANILYRYENGRLTREPLWDRGNGEFPHGAMIRGLNDLAGSSAFDVHKRLKVGPAGCFFPDGY